MRSRLASQLSTAESTRSRRDPSGTTVSIDRGEFIGVSDPTGMMDCFHAALMSFLLRTGWRLDDDDVMKAGLGFANEVAGFCGTGIGADASIVGAGGVFAPIIGTLSTTQRRVRKPQFERRSNGC